MRFEAPPGAYAELVRTDIWLQRVAETHGCPDPFAWEGGTVSGGDRFASLALHITSQQIATTVAQSVFQRLQDAAGPVFDADSVARLGPDRLHELGLSRAKAISLTDLARRVRDGSVDVDDLDGLTDDEVVAVLTTVRGIGRRTAEMFLIHQLRRPDVLPAGDLGIRRAVHRAARHAGEPDVEESDIEGVRAFGRRWAPYRTYAAALLWASLSDLRAAAPAR